MSIFHSPTHERKKYEYIVCSVAYKGKNPFTAKPTERKVLRAPQVLFDPNLPYYGLDTRSQLIIKNLEVGKSHTDNHGDHWRRIA